MNRLILSLGLVLGLAGVAHAGEIEIVDSYARVGSPMAKSGAAFLVIRNGSEADDQLVAVFSDVAMRTELHTHVMDGDVMKMREVEGGFPVPAGGTLEMQRGGDHVMMMGLTERLTDGQMIELTLTFRDAGEMVISVEVDLDR